VLPLQSVPCRFARAVFIHDYLADGERGICRYLAGTENSRPMGRVEEATGQKDLQCVLGWKCAVLDVWGTWSPFDRVVSELADAQWTR